MNLYDVMKHPQIKLLQEKEYCTGPERPCSRREELERRDSKHKGEDREREQAPRKGKLKRRIGVARARKETHALKVLPSRQYPNHGINDNEIIICFQAEFRGITNSLEVQG